MTNYVSLHTHSHYSLMDGVATAQEYVDRAVQNGMTALAVTDHGTLSGHADFYRACTAAGIKPILGVEAYYCLDINDRRDRADRNDPLDPIYFHLTLNALNNNGLRNLHKMMESAWTEGYFHKPRIDWEILDEFGDDIMVGSGCMSGPINKALEAGNLAAAKAIASQFHARFYDNFYIEIMPHNVSGINDQLLELADSMGIKAIVTADCHHATPDQRVVQEMTLLLNTHQKSVKGTTYEGSKKHDDMMDRLDYLYGPDRQMTFRNFDIHLMSAEEMYYVLSAQGMDHRPDLFQNTLDIADRVEPYDMPEGLDLLPVEYADPDKTLRGYAIQGLKAKGLDGQEYKDRLAEELQIIKDKHFASYFLMVKNITNYAHQHDILMSPGRGSAAGSLVSYALGITQLDPIKHNLLFFRFIDPSRDDAPDIDMDFEDNRREEVKEFVRKKYGNVASIATFTEFGDKSVVRDVSRVLGVPLDRVNNMLKHVNNWQEFLRSNHVLVSKFRMDYPEVIKYGEQLHGRIRGTGVHAAGVVASKVPLNEVAPIETRAIPGVKERLKIVAVDKDEAEHIGLIKMDILGLKTLTVIHDTLKAIKERQGLDIDLADLSTDDPNVYEMLNKGLTKGVFQVEAGPYTNLVMKMGVNNFDELAASNALVRPGAANTIGKDYIDRKKGYRVIKYPHKSMEPFLKGTYGCILYQEQVMQACVTLGGMTMAEANKVRKIIGKKKDVTEFDQFRDKFVVNASTLIGEAKAQALWHDFEAHAGYSFNLSHAVAYSTLSYQTAWLKCYYPVEFFWALLKNEKDTGAVTEYLIEAKRMGISVRLPHINLSDISWKIEDDGGLRFGLRDIKFISDISAQRFINARPFDTYKELVDFVMSKGTGVNSRALDSMRAVGAANIDSVLVTKDEAMGNAYDILGLPSLNADIPAHWYAKLTNAEDYYDGDTAILYGYVKGVKLGTGWQLYDAFDTTGSFKFFGRKNIHVEVGKAYIFVIAGKSVVTAFDISTIGGRTALESYLDTSTEPGFVVAATSYNTKGGQKMGTVVFDNGGELLSAVLFSSKFSQVAPRIKVGQVNSLNYSVNAKGDLVLNAVNA
jgi:DNA polymerase III subunit alpha